MVWLRLLRCIALVVPVAVAAQGQGRDPIPRLEAARARAPQSVPALRALGIAYYKAKRYEEARTVLEAARQLDPADGVSALYAGLAAEAVGDLTAARRASTTYLEVGKTARVRDDVQARLGLGAFTVYSSVGLSTGALFSTADGTETSLTGFRGGLTVRWR